MDRLGEGGKDKMLFVSFVYVLLVIYMISEAEQHIEESESLEQNVYIIAHRGASGYAPENTMASFEKAVELKADYIEMDIQMTKDGELVVFHDFDVSRTTNGSGAIKNFSLKDLKELDAGSWFHSTFKSEKIPTLKEVLSLYKHRIGLLIELKDPVHYPQVEEKLAQELIKAKLHKCKDHSIIVQSFDPLSIQKFHQILPEIPTAILTTSILSRKSLSNVSSFCQYVNPHFLSVSPHYVKELKEKELNSFIWTVNHIEDFKKITKYDINGIITDYPDLGKHYKTKQTTFFQNSNQFITFIKKAYQAFVEIIEKIEKVNI